MNVFARPFAAPFAAPLGLQTRISSQAGLVWLLRDDFLTDEAAPLASPRTCEPGPGTLTITDNGNLLSIAAGTLKYANASPAIGAIGVQAGALARLPGRVIQARITAPTTAPTFPVWLGWWRNTNLSYLSGANVAHGFYVESSTWRIVNNATILNLQRAFSVNVTYDLTIVLRTTGSHYLVKGGIFTDWTLLWTSAEDNTASLHPTLAPASGGQNSFASYDFIHARDLPAPFDTDYGIATFNVATPVSGTSYTATADAITDLTITAPNPLAESAGFRYRYADDNNCWNAYLNSAGSARLDSVSAGVATNRISVASVIAADATVTLRTISDGSLHDLCSLAGTTWTKRGGQVNVAHLNSNTAVRPYAGTGWTLGPLRSYPRTSPAYAELDRT